MTHPKSEPMPSTSPWPYAALWAFFVTILLAFLALMPEKPMPDMTFAAEHRRDIDRAMRRITDLQSEGEALRQQMAELKAKVAAIKPCACEPAEPKTEVFTIPIIVPFVKIVREEKIIHMPAPAPQPPIRVDNLPPRVIWDCYPGRRR